MIREHHLGVRLILQRLEAIRVHNIVDTQPAPHRTIGIAKAATLLGKEVGELLGHAIVDIRHRRIVEVTHNDMAVGRSSYYLEQLGVWP